MIVRNESYATKHLLHTILLKFWISKTIKNDKHTMNINHSYVYVKSVTNKEEKMKNRSVNEFPR